MPMFTSTLVRAPARVDADAATSATTDAAMTLRGFISFLQLMRRNTPPFAGARSWDWRPHCEVSVAAVARGEISLRRQARGVTSYWLRNWRLLQPDFAVEVDMQAEPADLERHPRRKRLASRQ